MTSGSHLFIRTVLLFFLLCAVTNADYFEARSDDKMPLKLKIVTKVRAVSSADRIQVVFETGEKLVLVDGQNGVSLKRDLIWLESAVESGTPVSHDEQSDHLLPATVAASVTLADLEDTPPSEESYFVFPRPAAVYLKMDIAGADRLSAELRLAIEQNTGAILAIRDAVFIEDVMPISRDQALRLLNLQSSN